MRILDVDNQKKLENIRIYLTPDEAKQMCDLLSDLLEKNKKNDLAGFDEISRKLILEDKT
jgi:hypothetical protein